MKLVLPLQDPPNPSQHSSVVGGPKYRLDDTSMPQMSPIIASEPVSDSGITPLPTYVLGVILQRKLSSFSKLSDNWDSYGAPRPNVTSIRRAKQLLEKLVDQGLIPTDVQPSAIGGTALVFEGKRNVVVEFYNDGDNLLISYANVPNFFDPVTEQFLIESGLDSIVDRIRRGMHAHNS